MKPVEWIASTRRDLKSLPDLVQDKIGYALYTAQMGQQHDAAKTLKGFGGGVIEVVVDFDRGTYRAVYTVRFAKSLYVSHVFQKKSKHGIATPKRDINLIEERLKLARAHYVEKYGEDRLP